MSAPVVMPGAIGALVERLNALEAEGERLRQESAALERELNELQVRAGELERRLGIS